MKKFILAITTLLLLSCNNSGKKTDALVKEDELSKKEVALEKTEKEVSAKENITVDQKYDAELNVSKNVIHCQNEKFIVRIDIMNNQEVRYSTWNKPKNESNNPDLILSNGEIEKQGSMGGYTYTFEKGEWKYIVEDKQIGESKEVTGRFLKLVQNEKVMLFTKMQDIK